MQDDSVFELMHRLAARSALSRLIDTTDASPEQLFGDIKIPDEGLGPRIEAEYGMRGGLLSDYERNLSVAFLRQQVRDSHDLATNFVEVARQFSDSDAISSEALHDAVKEIDKARLHLSILVRLFDASSSIKSSECEARRLDELLRSMKVDIIRLWETIGWLDGLVPIFLELWSVQASGQHVAAQRMRRYAEFAMRAVRSKEPPLP